MPYVFSRHISTLDCILHKILSQSKSILELNCSNPSAIAIIYTQFLGSTRLAGTKNWAYDGCCFFFVVPAASTTYRPSTLLGKKKRGHSSLLVCLLYFIRCYTARSSKTTTRAEFNKHITFLISSSTTDDHPVKDERITNSSVSVSHSHHHYLIVLGLLPHSKRRRFGFSYHPQGFIQLILRCSCRLFYLLEERKKKKKKSFTIGFG